MKLYLAAKFERKMELRDVRDFLVNDGHEITARWLDVEQEGKDDETRIGYAKMDVADVLRADVLVAFSDPRDAPGSGGGRHVEFGIALRAGKKIIVVGPKGEHIFHYLPYVEHVSNIDALAERLHQMDRPLAMDEGAGDAMHGKKKQ